MRIIVDSKYFAEFLNVQVNNCTIYFIHLSPQSKTFHIKTDQDEPDGRGEHIYVDSFRDPEDVEVTGDQLRGLKRFLKAIPHQPIVIEFKPDEKIKCSQFIAEF